MEGNRTKKSAKSMTFSLMYYFLNIVLSFVVRTIFIHYLERELLGLNGLFSNVLTVLSLPELGIGAALTCVMYKPLAENNEARIVSVYQYYKKIYLIIMCVVVALGGALCPLLPYIIKGDAPSSINLYIVYGIFAFNNVLSYLSAPHKSLLMASQRNYVNSIVDIIRTVFIHTLQIVAIVTIRSFYAYIIILPISSIVDYLIIRVMVAKQFGPMLKRQGKQKVDAPTKKEIKKNVGALVIHKIAGVLVDGTDNIIISSFIGLAILGMYSNYFTLVVSVGALLGAIVVAMRGSIGNVVVTESPKQCYGIFKRLECLIRMFIGVIAICLLCMFQPFVKVWAGKDWLLDKTTVFLIVICFYVRQSRQMPMTFKENAGLSANDKYRAIWEIVINLAVSLVLVHYIGLAGIIIGTIASFVFGPFITEPYIVYKHLFKEKLWKYFVMWITYTLATCATAAVMWFVCGLIPIDNWGMLIVGGIVCAVGSVLVMSLLLCWSKDFRSSIKWLFVSATNILKSLFKKKKKAQSVAAIDGTATTNVDLPSQTTESASSENTKKE